MFWVRGVLLYSIAQRRNSKSCLYYYNFVVIFPPGLSLPHSAAQSWFGKGSVRVVSSVRSRWPPAAHSGVASPSHSVPYRVWPQLHHKSVTITITIYYYYFVINAITIMFHCEDFIVCSTAQSYKS